MANLIKLRKGLDIKLEGAAIETKVEIGKAKEYALQPDDFIGVVPKVVVREGERVKAGEPLFVDKNCPDVRFASPVSGEVTEVVRGDRRKVLCVKVKADAEQEYAEFGKKDVSALSGDEVKQACLATSTSCPMQLPLIPRRLRRLSLSPHFATCLWQESSSMSCRATRRLSRLV